VFRGLVDDTNVRPRPGPVGPEVLLEALPWVAVVAEQSGPVGQPASPVRRAPFSGVIPTGAPQTGFGGASQSTDPTLVYVGGVALATAGHRFSSWRLRHTLGRDYDRVLECPTNSRAGDGWSTPWSTR